MKDRVAGAPGQYSAVVSGAEFQRLQRGEPFSITLVRDDKPEVEGTPYSKAAVLPDALATRLCPGLDDPSPADAFSALADQGVISQGEKDGWLYRQWANGMAECWTTIENPASDANPGMIIYPFLFKSEPITMVTFNMRYVELPISTVPLYKGYGAVRYSDPETNELTEFFYGEGYGLWGVTPDGFASTVPDGIIMNVYVIGEWKDLCNVDGGFPIWEGGMY